MWCGDGLGEPVSPGLSFMRTREGRLMHDDRIGKLASDALATLRSLPDTRELPEGVNWGDVMTFEGWSVRRARQAQRVLGLRLAERGGSVAEDVWPKPY